MPNVLDPHHFLGANLLVPFPPRAEVVEEAAVPHLALAKQTEEVVHRARILETGDALGMVAGEQSEAHGGCRRREWVVVGGSRWWSLEVGGRRWELTDARF